jgi:hypothetical protein
MTSITDRIIRDIHAELVRGYGDAGSGEILDHLAWEVGGAASELVGPARWVGRALVSTGICANASEAHARIARLVAWQAGVVEGRSRAIEPSDASASPRTAHPPTVASDRDMAVARLEADIADATLPIHARLESCDVRELDQAAETMLMLAMEHGDAPIVEDVIVSLLIFSGDWGDARWWDAPPPPENRLHEA